MGERARNSKTNGKQSHYTSGAYLGRGLHLTRGDDDQEGEEGLAPLEWFKASDASIDRHGTIVEPEGIELERYQRNPIVGWGHDVYGRYDGSAPPPDHVLGATREHQFANGDFSIGVEFAAHETARTVQGMLAGGFLGATSIGFIPLADEVRTIRGDDQGQAGDQEVLVFTRVELLEVSVVPLPSNPNAVREVRALVDALQLSTDPLDPETRVLFPHLAPPRATRADNGIGLGAISALAARLRLSRAFNQRNE